MDLVKFYLTIEPFAGLITIASVCIGIMFSCIASSLSRNSYLPVIIQATLILLSVIMMLLFPIASSYMIADMGSQLKHTGVIL